MIHLAADIQCVQLLKERIVELDVFFRDFWLDKSLHKREDPLKQDLTILEMNPDDMIDPFKVWSCFIQVKMKVQGFRIQNGGEKNWNSFVHNINAPETEKKDPNNGCQKTEK